MSHNTVQIPRLEPDLDSSVDRDGTHSGVPTFATPPNVMGLHEKDELMQQAKRLLQLDFEAKTKAIRIVAQADRIALEEGIRLSRQIEQANITVQQLYMERRLQELRGEIYGESMEHGPIRKLPGEMLSTIFQYHVENDLSPWLLVKVCKMWMHIAMMTPQLWCHLFILNSPDEPVYHNRILSYIVNGRIERSVGRMQVCANQQQVQAAIERSGAALPLSVKISDSRTWEPNGIAMSNFLRFTSHPLSERLGDLDIGRAELKDLKFEGNTAIGRLPLLRSMRLPFKVVPYMAKLIESISSTSKVLETAIFSEGIPVETVPCSFWPLLKRITIENIYGASDMLNQLIDQLGGIERLDGPRALYGWPNCQTPISALGNVHELALDCSPRYLGRLLLPQLRTLSLTTSKRNEESALGDFEPMSFPMVETLELSTSDPNWHIYTAGAFPAVQKLSLTWLGDDVMPINTLEDMPSVRNVKIRGPSTSITFGILLMKALRLPDEPVLCVNLEKLSLGDSVATPKGRLVPWIKKVVQFRQSIGRPLQELTVGWKTNKELVNYAAV